MGLLLTLALAACGGPSDGSGGTTDVGGDFVGPWILVGFEEDGVDDSDVALAAAFGVSVTLELEADHTATLDLSGQVEQGTWEASTPTEGTFSASDFSGDLALRNGRLILTDGTDTLVFSRAEDISVSEAEVPQDEVTFDGVWFEEDLGEELGITLTLNSDGTATYQFMDGTDTGTWETDSLTTGRFEGEELAADLELVEDKLKVSDPDGQDEMTFVRQDNE